MTSSTTQGRHDGTEQGRHDGTAAGKSAIEINTEDIAKTAVMIVGQAIKLEVFRQQLMDPGLSSLLYRPELAGLTTAAKAALEAARVHLVEVTDHTVKMAQLFETVEAGYYGTGVPELAWKQFVEAQMTNPDKPFAFLDPIESAINRKVGPASFKDVNDVRTAIESYKNLVEFHDAIATVGINQTLRRELRGGATKARRQAARRAIAEALGEPANGHIVGDIVNEYIERGSYGGVDELIARVSAQSGRSVNAVEANRMRATLVAAAPRFGRRVAVVHEALADRTTLAAARAAGLVDRVPGVATSRRAVSTAVTAAMEAKVARSTVRGVAKGVAGKAFVAVDVIMVPIDVRNAVYADTNLGRASAGASAVSGTLAIAGAASAAGIISAPAAPVLFLASGAMFLTSLGLGYADGRNQQKHYEAAYEKAYGKAYRVAVEEAINDRVDDQIQAIDARFQAKRASLRATPRATPAPVTVQRMAARQARTAPTARAAA